MAPPERASVLTTRTWTDPHTGVRAHLHAAEDPAARRTATARGIEDVCAMVREWLEALEELGDPDVTSR